ncbi:MAG: lipocalin family protein [Candidatus Binatia bacterium]
MMESSLDPIPLVPRVELPRFMGDWYVIAHVPTFIDRGGHNQVENYRLTDDGKVATMFTFRKDSFDGKEKLYTPTGYVREGSNNALWGMQFLWPIKGEYRIVYLESDYSVTIVGRNKRDLVWLMSRQPQMSEAEYGRYRALIAGMGYDVSKLVRVPQRWPQTAKD